MGGIYEQASVKRALFHFALPFGIGRSSPFQEEVEAGVVGSRQNASDGRGLFFVLGIVEGAPPADGLPEGRAAGPGKSREIANESVRSGRKNTGFSKHLFGIIATRRARQQNSGQPHSCRGVEETPHATTAGSDLESRLP